MLKVSELIGAQLDYWVARAEGIPAEQLEIREIQRSSPPAHHCVRKWNSEDPIISPDVVALQFSTLWARGGPIIEHEKISIVKEFHVDEWQASLDVELGIYCRFVWPQGGPTPLIAAMRCYVGSKFGEEVPECGN